MIQNPIFSDEFQIRRQQERAAKRREAKRKAIRQRAAKHKKSKDADMENKAEEGTPVRLDDEKEEETHENEE